MNTIVAQTKSVVTAADLPRIFGQNDARHGASFCPEMYHTHKDDKREYALGYESVTGPTFATVQFTGTIMGERN